MLAPVLAPVLTVALTPGALRAGLVLAVIRIRLALTTLPPSSAFPLAVGPTTEALLGNLRARSKTRPAGCTRSALHGSPPRTDYPVMPCAARALKIGRRSIPLGRLHPGRPWGGSGGAAVALPERALPLPVFSRRHRPPPHTRPLTATTAQAPYPPPTTSSNSCPQPDTFTIPQTSGTKGGLLLASTTGLILESAPGQRACQDCAKLAFLLGIPRIA